MERSRFWPGRDEQGGWPHARTPAELREQVHDNLRHLGLDVLDVVNLRVGGLEEPEPGSIAAATLDIDAVTDDLDAIG
jgi:aryl-alcohol dehydrogenase-like predicted oxidoreductase